MAATAVVADFKILALDEAGEEGLGESETGLSMATGSDGEVCRFPQKSPQLRGLGMRSRRASTKIGTSHP
jgi:hypothetical protein